MTIFLYFRDQFASPKFVALLHTRKRTLAATESVKPTHF
jgi:hypothetical protein